MTSPVWHSIPPDQAVAELKVVDPAAGLTNSEAETRLAKYGRNELSEQPRPGFLTRLLNQFKDMVVLLLIGASIVSAVLGEYYEAGAIILIVILNAVLGVVQEGRAEEALAALKKMSAPEAHVLRGGHVVQIPEAEVVPGDIVLLEAGNYVPADVRLLETANLQIDEASLTGESVPVTKDANREIATDAGLGDRKTMAYKSTIATYGRGRGVVVTTGMQTEIGKIAEMIQAVEEEETPLQRRLDQLGRSLAYAALAICGLVFALAVVRAAGSISETQGITSVAQFFSSLDQPGVTDPLRDAGLEAFILAVSLAIAAVPEGLPAIVTINLALGMREMIKRNALIRRLPAVETLGSASAIASDKTGTLTQNEMTAVKLYVPDILVDISGRGYEPSGNFHREGITLDPQEVPDLVHLLRGALLSSDARLEEEAGDEGRRYRIAGDPTEGALVVAAAKANLTRAHMEEMWPREDELPFDSARKRMSTLHNDPNGNHVLFVKGAPDVVLDLCTHVYDKGDAKPLAPQMKDHIANVNRDLAQQALRVLAVAERRFKEHPVDLSIEEHEKDLIFIGLIGMIDPARVEVAPAIAKARSAGIKTVMVTGDYPETARAIAKEIGLIQGGERVISGAELEVMSDADLQQHIDEVSVFARVSPEHKVRIVEAFRNRDYVVAMTGDGVNDAPALKRASIGVAMGITGTDVSKETADMVLTDDNYVSIVSAVEQGRIIYDNIRKFVAFLLTCNLAEIMVIFIGVLLGHAEILTPIQLLWLNLLTDGAPALALGVEKGDPDIMDRPPRAPNEPIINRVLLINMVVQTIVKTACTLGAYFIGLNQGVEMGLSQEEALTEARSMAFIVLAFSELLRAYSARSEWFSVFKIGVFSNKWMQYAVLTSGVLLLLVVYVPFLQEIFDTRTMAWREWLEMLPLIILPFIAGEFTKLFLKKPHTAQPTPVAATAAGG